MDETPKDPLVGLDDEPDEAIEDYGADYGSSENEEEDDDGDDDEDDDGVAIMAPGDPFGLAALFDGDDADDASA